MKYNVILKIPEASDASYDSNKILNFVKGLGWKLMPVQGAYNKFWITAKDEDGKRCEMVDGPKYYKLVINSRDFGIESSGDFNGWSFASSLRQNIKESREVKKVA